MKIKAPRIKLNFTTVIIIGLVIFFVILGLNRLITNLNSTINPPSNTQGLPRDIIETDSSEESTDSGSNTFDPTNPSTYSDISSSANASAEPITNVTLLEYISGTNPSTDNYSLYIDGNQAIIVLKNGYTKQQFEQDFLSRFNNVGNAQLVYVNEADYKDMNP